MKDVDKIKLTELILKSLHEDIQDEEFSRLQSALSTSEDARSYYKEIVTIYLKTKEQVCSQALIENYRSTKIDFKLWQQMADYEKLAPSIRDEDGEVRPISEEISLDKTYKIGKLHELKKDQKTARKAKRWPWVAAVLTTAALLAVFLNMNRFQRRQGVELATIVDAVGPTWADSASSTDIGARLLSEQGPLQLTQGVVKIAYDQGVDVILEGPAEVEMLSTKEIALNYGRLYACVSKTGRGFTVRTHTAKIVDLGTEFGVFADLTGRSEVHVIKGAVELQTDTKEDDRETLHQSQACVINPGGKKVRTIPCNEQYFVRNINSREDVVWKGNTSFSLADLVAGGDGFSKTISRRGIDPASGHISQEATRFNRRMGKGRNIPVRTIDCIDSVFVPDNNKSGFFVSTTNLKFKDFHDTDQHFRSDITTYVRIPRGQMKEDPEQDAQPSDFLPVLNGKRYGGMQYSPAIMISPNAGITFDLKKIRQKLTDQKIASFKTVCGVPENTIPAVNPVQFWVIVDGVRVEFFKAVSSRQLAKEIDIPISPQDRFLTLVTTAKDAKSSNWALFAEPQLVLEAEK